MAKICDICGGKIKFRSFRCQDGTICKKCYPIVSNRFTSIITGKTITELRQIYEKNAAPIDLGEDGFQVTRKVGTVLLLDEQRKKFCIPSNWNITKSYTRPEVFSYSQLVGYKLVTEPSMQPEELAVLFGDKKSNVVIKHLAVCLRLTDGSIRELTIIPSAVRASSYAFQKSYQIAMNLFPELDMICENP